MTCPLYSSRRLSLLVVSLMTLGAATNCGRAVPPEDSDAPPAATPAELALSAEQISHGGVKWTPAALSTVTETVELPGGLKVDEDHTARISAPSRGRLLAIRANVGDRVARGQVLAALQSEDASAARGIRRRRRLTSVINRQPWNTPGRRGNDPSGCWS